MRARVPKDELLWNLTPDDVRHLSPEMRKCLTLRCGNSRDISQWRKQQLIRKFQRRPFDTNSPAVRIACLTEKILRLRAHLLRTDLGGLHQEAKRAMRMYLTRRTRTMKSLYKSDYTLYRHTCTELGIRCIRFAIPLPSANPQKMLNPQAVDGDHARFLIRHAASACGFSASFGRPLPLECSVSELSTDLCPCLICCPPANLKKSEV